MIYVASEALLDTWPHHEWKQDKNLPRQKGDDGLRRLLGGALQEDGVAGADRKGDHQSDVSRRGCVGRGVVSRIGAVFGRRR